MALQALRSNLKSLSWILWLVIIALSIYVFANWGAQGQLGAPTSVVAWVDGEEILYKEYVEQLRSLDDQYRQIYGRQWTPEMSKMLGLQRKALDNLINSRVLLRLAREMDISTSKEEVARRILELPVFTNEKGEFVGQDRYKRYLEGYGKRVPEFERDMANDLVITKLGDLLNNGVVVSDEDLERIYREQNEQIGFDYVVFQVDDYLQQAKSQVSEADARAWYDEHKEDYRTPPMRRIAFVKFSALDYRDGIEVSEADAKTYYDEHIAEYTQEEMVRASHILIGTTNPKRSDAEAKKIADEVYAKLKKGAKFDRMVKEYSNDVTTVPKNGDLDFFPRGRMVKEFEDAAFSLKVGEISEPVKTMFGYHIIKVTDRKEKKVEAFDDVKADIINKLKFQRAQKVAEEKALAFATFAKEKKDLKAAAEEKGLKLNDSGFFANEQMSSIKGLGPATRVNSAAFSMQMQEISDAVSTAEGQVVFQVLEEKDPEIPTFDDVKDKVITDVARDRAAVLARKDAEAFRTGATFKTFEKQAKRIKKAVQHVKPVTRASVPANFVFEKDSDALEKLFSYDKDQVTEPLPSRYDDLLVCVITEKKPFDRQAFLKQIDSLRQQEKQRLSNELFTTLVSNARKVLEDEGKIEVRKNFQEFLEQNQ